MPGSLSDPDAAFDRRAAYLPAADALVVADLHLGQARDSNVEFPVDECGDARERLLAAVDRFDPGTVVVAGDLLHAFDRVPPTVADDAGGLLAAVADAGAAIAVTPGNHDTMLGPVVEAADAEVQVQDAVRLDDGTVVSHGHDPPTPDADRYVLGHVHPAITIEGARHPCFLYGEASYRGADVLVLPAFTRLARGVDVAGLTGEDALSPVLAGGVGTYRPVVYDEDAGESLVFPPLAGLREHL